MNEDELKKELQEWKERAIKEKDRRKKEIRALCQKYLLLDLEFPAWGASREELDRLGKEFRQEYYVEEHRRKTDERVR